VRQQKDSGWPEWPVCNVTAMGDPGARGFLTGDDDWPFRGFVVHHASKLYAYANICPHRRHPLDNPPDAFLVPDGSAIRCSSHGALFDIDSGECILGPCHGQNLLALKMRIDDTGMIFVTAPASLRDVGSIDDPYFSSETKPDEKNAR
jgi:nitrite reductase/ring-hydroxylating ferredoxin subunit